MLFIMYHQQWMPCQGFFFGFLLFSAAPAAYRSSQDPIGAVVAGLRHNNMGSKPRLRPTPQLTATPDP